jgi:hypothetical protein
MKSGSRPIWTPTKERALIKVGEKADIGLKKRDWEYGLHKCPRESKILEEFSTEQLRKTYYRIVKSREGICFGSCNNKTDGKNRYCESCRKKNAERALKNWNKTGKFKRGKTNV